MELLIGFLLIMFTGWVLFKLLTTPLKVLGIVFKILGLILLGSLVWLALLYWVVA